MNKFNRMILQKSLGKNIGFIITIMVVALSFAACTTTRESYYFKALQKDTAITGFVNNNFESKIKAGDMLSILVTSFSKEEDVLFNQAAGDNNDILGAASTVPGFLVQPDGTILLHRFGNFKAEGLTRKELSLALQKELQPFMKDPVVNVNYINHKVTILGAVAKPQVLSFQGDHIPLIDALVSSGDITPNGRRNDVMIIRDQGTEKKIQHLNLEDRSIFKSPYYYIQPNDIVYVLEDYEKTKRTERRANIQTSFALAASGISLLLIVLDRIIR